MGRGTMVVTGYTPSLSIRCVIRTVYNINTAARIISVLILGEDAGIGYLLISKIMEPFQHSLLHAFRVQHRRNIDFSSMFF